MEERIHAANQAAPPPPNKLDWTLVRLPLPPALVTKPATLRADLTADASQPNPPNPASSATTRA